MPQNSQHTISQTAIKHYNQLRSVRTEALIWLQFTTALGNNLKIEIDTKHRYQQLIDFIPIEIIKVYKKPLSEPNIITISVDHIINNSFNKTPITW